MTVDDLLIEAREARKSAYARYSGFAVGAAVLAESGRVYIGANVENASYGLTMCAERVAIFGAIAAGERVIRVVAVVTGASTATPPCGACRQVIHEFGPAAKVVSEAGGHRNTWSLEKLLPHAFGPASLPNEPPETERDG